MQPIEFQRSVLINGGHGRGKGRGRGRGNVVINDEDEISERGRGRSRGGRGRVVAPSSNNISYGNELNGFMDYFTSNLYEGVPVKE